MITTSSEQHDDAQVPKKSDIAPKEPMVELSLRPQVLEEYIGQSALKKNLRIFIDAAKKRNEPIDHVLFYGPPGLGKTTIAHIIARELGVAIKVTSGPAIERVGDLGSILTNLQDGDILFIDEIHRLNKSVEEILYPAMEDHKLDIVVGKGPSAHTLQLDLPKFTLIGATTRLGALSNPLRDRFGATHRMQFYTQSEIEEILLRSSTILGCALEQSGAAAIAQCARQTPRVANRLLKRVRDYADIHEISPIDGTTARKALTMLDVDTLGLEPADRALLMTIIDTFGGGPVGVQTLARAISEEVHTIEDVFEPYLMQLGFLERTPRGRVATKKAYEHINKYYRDGVDE